MNRKRTLSKIRKIEKEYGSLVNAYDECKISASTYYRWRSIILTPEYNIYILNNENKI